MFTLLALLVLFVIVQVGMCEMQRIDDLDFDEDFKHWMAYHDDGWDEWPGSSPGHDVGGDEESS